jgi:hypothetical protein
VPISAMPWNQLKAVEKMVFSVIFLNNIPFRWWYKTSTKLNFAGVFLLNVDQSKLILRLTLNL